MMIVTISNKKIKINYLQVNYKSVKSSNLKTVSDTKVNGSGLTVMVTVNKCGLMVLVTQVNGKKTKHQVRVHSLMPMVINIKVNGRTIRHMDMECSYMQNHLLDIKDIGRMI